MSLKKKTKGALKYTLGSAMLKFWLPVLGMIFLVRYLEPADYGIYVIIGAMPGLIHLFTSIGYDFWIVRFVPMMDSPTKVADRVLSILVRRVIVVSLIAYIVMASFGLYADRLELTGFYLHVLVYQIAVLTEPVYRCLAATFNAQFMQRHVLFLELLYQVLFFAVIVLGVELKRDLLFFISGLAICSLVRGVVTFGVFVRHFQPNSWKGVLSKQPESDEEQSYRRISYINEFGASFLSTGTDKYILAAFSSSVQVAIYNVAARLLSKLSRFFPHSMLKPLVEPAFYLRYEKSGEVERLNGMFQFLFNANLIIGFFFVALFIPLGRDLLTFVFTEKYVTAYWPTLIFLFFIVLYSIPVGMVAKALKQPKILLYSKVSVIFNVVTGIPLALLYGALGMAISTILSIVLKNAIIFYLVRRRMDLQLPWEATLRASLHMAATATCVWLLPQATPLFAKLCVGGLVYLMTNKLLPVFSPDQSKLLVSLLPKRFHPVLNWYLKPVTQQG